jgi:hypothetical protein
MAFTQINFLVNRGGYNPTPNIYSFAVHRYTSAIDSISTIATSGYFPPWFGYTAEEVRNNDYIQVQASNGNTALYLVAVSMSGVITLTAAIQNSQLMTIASVVTGLDAVTTPAITLTFYVNGPVTYMWLPAFSFASSSIVGVATISPLIPTNIAPAPSITMLNNAFVIDEDQVTPGLFYINSTGLITIGDLPTAVSSTLAPAQFTGGIVGWLSNTFSWPTAGFLS